MKPESLVLLLAFAAAPLGAAEPDSPTRAAPTPPAAATERLAADVAVFSAPDPKSAILARLKAGAALTPSAEPAPTGWRRVVVAGPFEAYAHTRDITKNLEVKEGARIHSAPRVDASVLTVAAAGDKTAVIGLAGGEWCQIRLEKPLDGYIAVGETANLPAAPSRPITFTPPPSTGGVAGPGRPAQFSGNTADLPRIFQGQLTTARALLNPNPPYDYQLTDAEGRRIAYLDLRRVNLTQRLESLVGRPVTITGTLRNTVDGKDLVVAAESLQVK